MNEFSGLSKKQAQEKLNEFGFNELKEINKVSGFGILLRQVKNNFLVYLLFFAAIMSFFIGKAITGYAIFGVIFVVVILGFVQEYRAEKSINALKQMIIPVSIVIRDRKEIEIESKNIVPGDIIVLRTGEKIPADCIVLESKELLVNESALTGESKGVKKIAAKTEDKYGKENLVFMGTYVIEGKCIAKVLHTGMNTAFGKIAGMISKAEKELPLQKKVNDIVKFMAFVAICVSVLSGIIMLIKNIPFSSELLIEVIIVVIALCVSAFPEGLPVVLISVLAKGAWTMAGKNAIVNRMSIIETLGETTIICTDKTGTLTKGEMTVKKIFIWDKIIDVEGSGYKAKGDFIYNNKKINTSKNIALNKLFRAAVLCNDSKIERKGNDEEYRANGTPTETSLLIMSAKAGIYRDDLNCVRQEEIPFNSNRKKRSVLIKEKDENYIYSIGAIEVLLDKCSYIQSQNKIIELENDQKQKILNINKKLTQDRFRVLCICCKQAKKKEITENDLVFLGLAAMDDPPREEIPDALKSCKQAGIKVKMITGDNKETAKQIGKQIGIDGEIISGNEIDQLTDYELSKSVNNVAIFARVRPEHKLRIVNAFRKNNEIVTMTGDGVNDAPALKQAHIGVAMGKNGTDVSRQASDLILKDDNFATIVSAIKEGRVIFNNLQKCVAYQLSCNYAELIIIFFGILLGFPLPLLALQILFMNLVTDDLTAIALGFNPSSGDIMKIKPRKKKTILNKELFVYIAIAAIVVGVVCLSAFFISYYVLGQSIAVARTTTLITLVFMEIANAYNFRSFRKKVIGRSLLVNKYLFLASILSVLLTLLVVYFAGMNSIFETLPVGLVNISIAVFSSLLIVVVFDVYKKRKVKKYNINYNMKK
ncbi:MAG: cation transporter [Candidatus Aenigmarchaeota archaeon ex4484_52]|nr:MAG: cation transporter [Candidatus Aenigmarchaeota archaeon ex4484_52]